MPNTFLDQTPIRIGSAEEFDAIYLALKAASFDEQTICRAFDLRDMSEIGTITGEAITQADISADLRILIRLFFLPAMVPRVELERSFAPKVIDSFLSLGLLGTGEFGRDDFYARALLYPAAGFLIASDRHSLPDESEFEPPPDLVFPAIFGGTLQFLRLLPRNWHGAALDLCSGSGVGAFALSRFGERAVSADVTQRAADFAAFNCALNRLENVEVVRGDLYEGVARRTFGCIVAHPPYVPSLETKAIWRDGGVTGEALVKRMIEGLPEHLEPGGVFLCLSLGADTNQERFEERVRQWLGTDADAFDIIFGCKEVRECSLVLDSLARRHTELGPDVIKKFESEFERLGVKQMPFGALSVRRAAGKSARKPLTIRTVINDQTDGSSFDTAWSGFESLAQPDFLKTLEQAMPRLAPGLEVKVTHVVENGSLVPADVLFEVDQPFVSRVRFESWMVPLLARLDGKTALATILEQARADGAIPEEFKLENFAVLIAHTLERGFTLLDRV